MTTADAQRTITQAGPVTAAIGAGLVAAPARPAALLGLRSPTALRVIGVTDLPLVPGLLFARPRRPRVLGRVGLDGAMIARCLRQAREAGTRSSLLRVTAVALGGLSIVDGQAARTLRVEGL